MVMAQSIGFIGLGVMGLPMARRLAEAGHALVVYDPDPQTSENLASSRVTIADSVADVADRCELLLTCLPNPQAVESVYDSLQAADRLACDFSTIGPHLARRLHRNLRERGIGYIECPMLGGAGEAAEGQLFFILSGVEQDVESVLPLLQILGREYRYVGGPGSANRIKVVQNGLGLVQLAAIAEALSILASDGADLAQFCDIVSAGGGMADTPLFRARAPLMLQENPQSDARLRIGAKDIGLACALADELQLQQATPLFHAAEAMFRQAVDAGLSEAGTTTIARIAERRVGVSFTHAS